MNVEDFDFPLLLAFLSPTVGAVVAVGWIYVSRYIHQIAKRDLVIDPYWGDIKDEHGSGHL